MLVQQDKKINKRTIISTLIVLIVIPLTIAFGVIYLDDRKYYLVSIFILIYIMIPFFMVFEKRKPQARELVIIAVLCAIGVVGRAIFFMLPQFKPVVALVIITGVAFGAESGFLVGAITAFVSNFFFGQGPWTPWQMFSFGIIGFLAGILFDKGIIKKEKMQLCIFGAISTFVIYGGIMNFSSLVMSTNKITAQSLLSVYIAGIPMDCIHALATIVFLFFISEPMIEKLDRVKKKYGLIK